MREHLKQFPLSGLLVLLVLAAVVGGCADGKRPLFERLPPERTGVDFVNTIAEDDSLLNSFDLEYIYNGAGVATADFNDDGLPDLFFGGNDVDSRLYLNRGDMRFEDVTASAGVAAAGSWVTGVAAVDINQDGHLDVYLSVAGPGDASQRANKLFVNQGVDEHGVPRFAEQAESYGLADTGYSTHAAFFDYDGDGDLDLYLLTNSLEDIAKRRVSVKRMNGQAANTDRMYRNNGDGTFTDVSKEAGILAEGFGLGVVVSDLNKDGWPDVYVANDFLTNDLVYVNNGDGSFTNCAGAWLRHQTQNGMGVDAADFNNDARPDLVVLDMLPPDNYRRKLMLPASNRKTFRRSLEYGYEPQYLRNTLQLNRGLSPDGELVFSEIGQLAGIAATDWSWAPLFADFDNDGWKDLFVTNGYGKDVTNPDFAAYSSRASTFGDRESKRRRIVEALKELPDVMVPNVMYRNNGDLTFKDVTDDWGFGEGSLSNGAAFADLDDDGDLDLITNNINGEAFLYENRLNELEEAPSFLRVRFEGPPGNLAGLGARVAVRSDGELQYHEHTLYRGYKSTVEDAAHFGLGNVAAVDSLEILWPDGRYQLLTGIPSNRTLTLRYADASISTHGAKPSEGAAVAGGTFSEDRPRHRLFEEESSERGLVYVHQEDEVDDFGDFPLLPHKLSQGGPDLAIGDVDGDGLDDLYVGGDRGQQRKIFLQIGPGRFAARPLAMDSVDYEDRGVLFFDADGNGTLDLYVVSGGNHAPAGDPSYQDRLYLGDGRGGFRRAEHSLPEMSASGSVVVGTDYDQDGDVDLFVGGRHRPGEYPLPPRSYLLENDGRGRFRDVTQDRAPELAHAGMITDALWTDFNDDGDTDLIVTGEWMSLRLFAQRGGGFHDVTTGSGVGGTNGWWNALAAADFDGDGDTDYIAGNAGLNTRFDAAPEEPVRIRASDFDRNGRIDALMTHYVDGFEVIAHPRDVLVEQIPSLLTRFPSYSSYAEATYPDVFSGEESDGDLVLKVTHLASSYFENRGNGTFLVRALPIEAQFAPVFGIETGDFDDDAQVDVLLAGNDYSRETTSGWQDAFTGLLLRGDGNGHFEAAAHDETGFYVAGDARAVASITAGPSGLESPAALILVAQRDDSLRAFVHTPALGAPAAATTETKKPPSPGKPRR